MTRQWWGTRKNVSPRLQAEANLMQKVFGKTFQLEFDPPNRLYWIGTVDINLTGIRYRAHTLKVIYPHEYPQYPPESYIVSPHIYSPKHQFEDGQLCLYNPKDGITYGWNPASGTAIDVAGWSIEWIYAFYVWKSTGRWPGIEERLTPRKRGWLSWR